MTKQENEENNEQREIDHNEKSKRISKDDKTYLKSSSVKQREVIQLPNVEFYLNRMSSYPNGTFIDLMHRNWWGNYIVLQSNHSYIQWLFPNSFQSRFNSSSKALTKQQTKIFRQTQQIGARMVKSYQMLLDFYGMRLKCRKSGEIVRSIHPSFKDRYDQTLLSAYHNHLRVSRILCSLTQCGFAYYARQLCKFLKKQILGQNGCLKRLNNFGTYKHWKPYEGDSKKRSDNVNLEEDHNIFLVKLWEREGYNPYLKERSKFSQCNRKDTITFITINESDQQNGGNQQVDEQLLQAKQEHKQIMILQRKMEQQNYKRQKKLHQQYKNKQKQQHEKNMEERMKFKMGVDPIAAKQMERLKKMYQKKLQKFFVTSKKPQTMEDRQRAMLRKGAKLGVVRQIDID